MKFAFMFNINCILSRKEIMMAEKTPIHCSCRWTKCKRHGKCEECIDHHKKHAKHPLPYCKKTVNKKEEDQ